MIACIADFSSPLELAAGEDTLEADDVYSAETTVDGGETGAFGLPNHSFPSSFEWNVPVSAFPPLDGEADAEGEVEEGRGGDGLKLRSCPPSSGTDDNGPPSAGFTILRAISRGTTLDGSNPRTGG